MEVFVLATITINPEDFPKVEPTVAINREVLGRVNGWKSTTVWQDAEHVQTLLIVTRYQDAASADEGLRMMVTDDHYVAAVTRLNIPADVHRFVVQRKVGRTAEELPIGSWLSLSARLAEPGQSDSLLEELTGIFDSLQALPGILGTISGIDEAVSERIFGLAFWDSASAFDDSMPRHPMYEIKLYHRII